MQNRSTFENLCSGAITGVVIACLVSTYRRELLDAYSDFRNWLNDKQYMKLERMWRDDER